MILRIPYLHRTLRGYFVLEREHSGIQISSINEVAKRKEIGSFRLPWWIGKLTEKISEVSLYFKPFHLDTQTGKHKITHDTHTHTHARRERENRTSLNE
jgi:hypothetical protein